MSQVKPMSTMDIKLALAVKTVVQHDFQNASARFYETFGHAETVWQDLEEAMWALQACKSPELIAELEKVGIGHWTKHLAARHKTRREA